MNNNNNNKPSRIRLLQQKHKKKVPLTTKNTRTFCFEPHTFTLKEMCFFSNIFWEVEIFLFKIRKNTISCVCFFLVLFFVDMLFWLSFQPLGSKRLTTFREPKGWLKKLVVECPTFCENSQGNHAGVFVGVSKLGKP